MAVLFVAVAALAGAPGAGAANPVVHPETRNAFLFAKGSNGWRLQITALLAPGRRQLGFYARGPHHQEVWYGVKGKAARDGTIEGTAPGIGRVAVKFEQTAETPVQTSLSGAAGTTARRRRCAGTSAARSSSTAKVATRRSH